MRKRRRKSNVREALDDGDHHVDHANTEARELRSFVEGAATYLEHGRASFACAHAFWKDRLACKTNRSASRSDMGRTGGGRASHTGADEMNEQRQQIRTLIQAIGAGRRGSDLSGSPGEGEHLGRSDERRFDGKGQQVDARMLQLLYLRRTCTRRTILCGLESPPYAPSKNVYLRSSARGGFGGPRTV